MSDQELRERIARRGLAIRREKRNQTDNATIFFLENYVIVFHQDSGHVSVSGHRECRDMVRQALRHLLGIEIPSME